MTECPSQGSQGHARNVAVQRHLIRTQHCLGLEASANTVEIKRANDRNSREIVSIVSGQPEKRVQSDPLASPGRAESHEPCVKAL